MQTITLTGKIEPDGHLRLDIPTQLPVGEVSIVVLIDGVDEIGGELNGLSLNALNSLKVLISTRSVQPNAQNPYPLRNTVLRYENPTDPVAEDDWDVLR